MSPGSTQMALPKMPAYVIVMLVVFTLSGIATFIAGLTGPDPLRTWQAYLVNFLFWTGLAFGAVLFVAILNVTGALWGRPLKRIAEAFAAFLPVSFLLFWLLYFGRMELFPWLTYPVVEKASWLNTSFLFVRDGFGLLLLTTVSVALVFFSVKADRESGIHLTNNGYDKDMDHNEGCAIRNWRRQKILSPIVIIAYSFVLTLLAFDLIMTLDPHWYSTLFGAYFLVGSFYTGVAAIYLYALATQTWKLVKYRGQRQLHDLGKLTLAFCLFTGYLFYAQFLTIWYGNVPSETQYIILRVRGTYWEPVAWLILFMIFVVPFIVLLSKRIKVKRLPMIILSLIILAGMWLERFVLVAPSLWRKKELPLGLPEMLITAGFAGILGLCLCWFMQRVPLAPISDPLFRELVDRKERRLEP
ncbi:MAG TPA: NrfD/PsrC family molybdoenzyme membrane anchor subunit [Syntrophorhabdaceae bacterium]|nr:NrfD/PsrC family molybdoenzyme membrane anchor subunit [Syntrophorhabdaceae bacterium]